MAEAKLTSFRGGINNWLEPHLIEADQATRLRDFGVRTGALVPLRGAGESPSRPEELAYVSAARSLVRWGGHYFWSDNETGALDSSIGYFGVESPESSPVVVPYRRGSRFVGKYTYLCTFSTVNGEESGTGPVGAATTFNATTIDTSTPYAVISEDTTTLDSADIPRFNASNIALDRSGESTYAFRGYVEAGQIVGPKNPNSAIGHIMYGYNVGDLAQLDDVAYQCVQDIRYDAWGEYDQKGSKTLFQRRTALPEAYWPGRNPVYWTELGAIDSSTLEVVTTGYDSLRITLPKPRSKAVSHVNLYRTVADGATYYRVASVPVGAERHLDNTTDEKLIANGSLRSTSAYPPLYKFANGGWEDVGGMYLTESGGVFALAYGDRMYLSEQSSPHSWNPLNWVGFEDTITGAAIAGSDRLVFTQNRTYRVSGSSIADLVKTDLNAGQGCTNWRTVAYIRNTPVWMSNDGLCSYSPVPNQDGKYVVLPVNNRYTFSPGYVFAVAANDVYWLFYEDYAVGVDFSEELRVYEYTVSVTEAYYDPDGDVLLGKRRSDGRWVSLFTGPVLKGEYSSPNLVAGDPLSRKRFRQVRVDADESVELSASVDGSVVYSKELKGPFPRFYYLPSKARGRGCVLTVKSKGTVRSLSVEVVPTPGR